MYSLLTKFLPINQKRIIFESEGDYSDNSQALFHYMNKHNFFNKHNYVAVWVMDNPKNYVDRLPAVVLNKSLKKVNFKLMYYLATCKDYIYDHNNLFENFRKRPGQRIIYLSHGFGYKAPKGYEYNERGSKPDMLMAEGDIPAVGLCKWWKLDINKAKKLGYPRNDYLLEENKSVASKVERIFKLKSYSCILLWMPTFRKSNVSFLSEDYLSSGTGLPLLTSKEKLLKFNEYLSKENILLILKLHHLQAKLDIFKNDFSNIKILRDEDLQSLDIQLYQFIKYTDALITDYSSISTDYLLLNKPIIYTLDDYDDYKKSRGIFPENALELMKGYHVYSIDELERSINEILTGYDRFNDERKSIIRSFFTYPDGHASERIVDYLGYNCEGD